MKFEVTYTIVREEIAFAKMNTLCERQRVHFGEGYQTTPCLLI